MSQYNTHKADRRTVRDLLFLLGVAIVLGLGLAFSTPAIGAGLEQSVQGDISGTITVTGGSSAGLSVELHQRTNDQVDTLLATTTTNDNGVYHFPNQPSAPNNAYYHVKVTGGAGMLAVWYSFPIIYLSGQNFTVPSIEMSDVALLSPANGDTVSLPARLSWRARRSGETFRVYVYDQSNLGKALLDSGSLGMNTEYALPAGALTPGSYEAVVQVRDAVVGYGVSQAHFRFNVGTGDLLGTGNDAPTPPIDPGFATPGVSTNQLTPGASSSPEPTIEPTAAVAPPSGQPELSLALTADKTEVQVGDTIVFRIEVRNVGSVIAPDVVVTDNLPPGVAVDAALAQSSTGLVSVDGNDVTAQIGDLNPNDMVVVQIPVAIGTDATGNISNQVSALYSGAANPAMSNAYIAQIAAQPVPPTVDPGAPPTETPGEPTAAPIAPTSEPVVDPTQAVDEPTALPQATVAPVEEPAAAATVASVEPAVQPTTPSAPTERPQATRTSTGAAGNAGGTPTAPIPQTGGSFPLAFAVLLLAVTLAARYMRGHIRSRNARRT